MGLAEYLEMVADYWSLSQDVCKQCDMNIEQGYCAMLHDSTVPDGDCQGLVAIGVSQPDEVPNAPHDGPGAASSRTVPLDAVVGRHRE